MTTNSSILDRVVERLKTSTFGEFFTEEDVFDIVKKAIPKVFMEERIQKDPSGGWNARDIIKPPLMFEVLAEVLREHVKTAAKEWFLEHHDAVMAQWKTVFDKGIEDYVRQVMEERTRSQVREMLQAYQSVVNKDREQQRLPPLYVPL